MIDVGAFQANKAVTVQLAALPPPKNLRFWETTKGGQATLFYAC